MTSLAVSFYISGGTLRPDAPCYVPRQADHDLYQALTRGEYCHVLTSRQRGKSSLMVRTAQRLRAEGTAVGVLDPTGLGQNLTVEQWYAGLLGQLGKHLDLEDDLEDYWLAHTRVAPLQRWLRALQELVLPRCPGRLVIFVDEIDAVRSLPFSTDEFFAAIRDCYNRRSDDSDLERLTFCLLGVATPADLIRDPRTTPFNIGQRIELRDFTAAEAAPLAQGLHQDATTARRLLQRILYWTGGHPYLTQRLCQAVVSAPGVGGPAEVDRICAGLFLSPGARGQETNLVFVGHQLLEAGTDRAGVLDLYDRVRRRWVLDDETNPLADVLRLAGIVRVENGYLRVRNRIYAHVFDRAWVRANMPDAELRRQRAAYRRGLLRAGSVAGLGVALLSALGVTFYEVHETQSIRSLQQKTDEARSDAVVARQAAETQAGELQVALGKLKQAEQQSREDAARLAGITGVAADNAWDAGRMEEARALLLEIPPQFHGWEWGYRKRHFQGGYCTLYGHTAEVRNAVFSPDGLSLATGSGDGTVKLWDARTGLELRTLRGHTEQVWTVAFSPDGQRLATASADRTVKLWDTRTGQELRTLRGHKDRVTSVVFSPDGQRLATGSGDETVKLWDAGTGQELRTLRGHKDRVTSVVFSPDGLSLATGSWDLTVKLWDARSGQDLLTLLGHTDQVLSVAFSPDGLSLATGSEDKTVKLWDARTGQDLLTLLGHTAGVPSVAFSPDGLSLATASEDKTVKLWDPRTGQELLTLRGHTDRVTSVAFSPDGQRLTTASADKTVKLWDARTAQDLLVLRGHTDPVWSVAFNPDGLSLATASLDQTVKLWDARTGQELRTLRGLTDPVTGVAFLAFSPDGLSLAIASAEQTAKLWDACTGQEFLILRGHTDQVWSVAFSPDGLSLATGSADKTVKLWDARTGHELRTLRGHKAYVTSVVFSPNGLSLATGSWDKTVKLWDARTGQELRTLRGHTERVLSVAFSPDGLSLATGSEDKTVKLWDARTGHELRTLRGHSNQVYSVAFSPDGQRLATASWDQTVKLWDARTGQELLTLRGHTDRVLSVAFSPDGLCLASASADQTVKLWDARLGQDEIEHAFREGMARFDVSWHKEQARAYERAENWFAAAMHWGQLVGHQPANGEDEKKLEEACGRLGSWQPALAVCDRLLAQDPTLAPLYFRRARLRGPLLEFHEATADQLAGLALASVNPVGWPSFAQGAADCGAAHANKAAWPQACRAYADAALWERQNASHRHQLAWAQLAAGDDQSFRASCRRLYDDYRNTADVEAFYRLSAGLGLGLAPGPSLGRGLGQPAADTLLQAMQASRNHAIVYTACLVPAHGLPARDLVRLATQNAHARRTADSLETLGAAQYRAGQHAEAIATLQEAVKLRGQGGSNWTKLFLAMAYQQQPDQARAWFEKAGLGDNPDWEQRLVYARLRGEALRLLKIDSKPDR